MNTNAAGASTVDASEVEKFSAIAAEWWNPKGKFGVLHKLNPVRLDYIRGHIVRHFSLSDRERRPFEGLTVLDIGCGGGLLCEPMVRLGAEVTGIDPAEKNIKTASVHASEQALNIDYRAITAEELAQDGKKFDIVLNMEVVEHVADVDLFMATSASLVKPGGLMFAATLNRTLKSFGLAIIGAEYVLGWLPRGTHQWEKFVTPQELEAALKSGGLRVRDTSGVTYNPLNTAWRKSPDTDVNYMMIAERPAA
ncbi:MAG: bifunctional 2-polyprenyl-6-hydroxyphenol methylase/3-demethylubiquinol 3-O-methyltransferase UbiG [Alphaproteobacteria bacterium]|nr:bifunctional 2-polyprenyl-6-hydroxyphenol methylase/3-demethylubiquinol 3-O-methyltransferase UbiG [Alphaproteobacteria bacterium]